MMTAAVGQPSLPGDRPLGLGLDLLQAVESAGLAALPAPLLAAP